MRVLLADDHVLIRTGLRALLLRLPDVREVFEASDGREALAAVSQHRPDVVFMDIAMPGMSGLEATSLIRSESPQTRVIILSMHAHEEYVSQALRHGASGYLVKAAAVTELHNALRTVTRGQTYVSPCITRSGGSKHDRGKLSPLERLTPRHRETLRLITEGLTSREIATTLRIHVKTVDSIAPR